MSFVTSPAGPDDLERAYGILCRSLARVGVKPDETPFGLSYCVIEPSKETSPHSHYDGEYFYILDGEGEMRIDGSVERVSSGSLVRIRNHRQHTLANLSPDKELKFLSIYWDQEALPKPSLGEKHLIIAAPPTPNGKLHVGHLSGPYFAADVLKKYLDLRKKKASYALGIDVHQSYVPFKGWQENRAPQAVLADYTDKIESILAQFRASPDFIVKPQADVRYREFVQEFFRHLRNKGIFYLKKTRTPYSLGLNRFVHEAYVSGLCPHCNEKTNGQGCEACGLYNDARDLVDPICNTTGDRVVLREIEKYYFDFSAFKSRLRTSIGDASLPDEMSAFAARMIESKVSEVSVSFVSDWGIPVPDLPGQVIYEWIEMAAAYLYHAQLADSRGAAASGQGVDEYWRDSKNKVILSFGFDNSFFYLGLVPALLWAFDSRIKYPDGFLINQFYLLNGTKFSTSRKHAVWGDELLDPALVDVLRLYLASSRPEGRSTNFVISEFSNFVEEMNRGSWTRYFESIAELGSELRSKGQYTTRFTWERKVTSRDRALLEIMQNALSEAESAYHWQQFSLNRVFQILNRLIDAASQARAERRNNTLLQQLTFIKYISKILNPIAPGISKNLRSHFGFKLEPNWETFPQWITEWTAPVPTEIFRIAPGALESFEKYRKSPAGKRVDSSERHSLATL